MTQERETPSLQLNSGERLQFLQQLKRHLDPFREGHEAEKLRALGLRNLYLQMVDPSVEFIEKVSVGLGSMPFSNWQQLQSDTYRAGENPEKFFVEFEITTDNLEKLQEGIDNSGQLMNEIASRYDYESGKLRWGENLDPKVFAESVYERIQISKEERQLRKAIGRIQNESDLRRRYRMGLSLKKQVLDYIERFSFKFDAFYNKDKPLEPTWENLTSYPSWSVELETKDGGSIVGGSFGIEEAVEVAKAAIVRHQLEKRLEQLPARDKEQFNQLRLKYGAKAANLIILSGLTGNINKAIKNHYDVELGIPDFQAVPVEFYRAWRKGKLADDDLRPYFEWVNGLKEKERWAEEEHNSDYIARSSAVFSEDGENVTGAGIYESVKIYGGRTFQDFKDAVIKVYESTNSPRAQAYREQHGIKEEEMGLIIQKYVNPDDSFNLHGQSQEGYINSRLTSVPQLMEIVTKTSRNFIKRKELDFFLALRAHGDEDSFRNIHHFPPDNYKVHPDLLIRAAQLASIVERIWKKDIQIEFVADGLTMNFVQVRELPPTILSQTTEIRFPDELPIHSGASIGMGNLELPVLDDEDDNSEKTGVVVFPSNDMWTMGRNSYRLPKEGAVIVCHPEGKFGHIQTLCAERGLVCIFPDMNAEGESNLHYAELSGLRKVRIISNGIEGRVYEAKSKQ